MSRVGGLLERRVVVTLGVSFVGLVAPTRRPFGCSGVRVFGSDGGEPVEEGICAVEGPAPGTEGGGGGGGDRGPERETGQEQDEADETEGCRDGGPECPEGGQDRGGSVPVLHRDG